MRPGTRVYQEGRTLYFDADGSGSAIPAVGFASLPEGVTLTQGDLTVA